MIVAFTGTREGMTLKQYWALTTWFHYDEAEAGRVATEVHHGCCVGADADFVTSVVRARIGGTPERMWAEIHAHPSDLKGMTARGALALSDVVHPGKPPLDRNRDIVDACDVLLACPKGPEERRSGTWATIRYARKVGKRVVILWPDGRNSERTERTSACAARFPEK